MEVEYENLFFFNCPLNLALRSELFVKTKQTCPELKHLDNLNKITIMLSSESS